MQFKSLKIHDNTELLGNCGRFLPPLDDGYMQRPEMNWNKHLASRNFTCSQICAPSYEQIAPRTLITRSEIDHLDEKEYIDDTGRCCPTYGNFKDFVEGEYLQHTQDFREDMLRAAQIKMRTRCKVNEYDEGIMSRPGDTVWSRPGGI